MLIIFIKSFSSLYVNNFSLSTNLRDNISKSSIKCIFLSVYSTPLIGNSLFLLSVFMANTFCKLFVISNVCRFSSLGGNVYRFSSLGGRWGLAFLLIYEQLITYIVFHFITDIYDVNKYTSNLIHDICILDRLFADTYNCHSPYTVQTEFVSVIYQVRVSAIDFNLEGKAFLPPKLSYKDFSISTFNCYDTFIQFISEMGGAREKQTVKAFSRLVPVFARKYWLYQPFYLHQFKCKNFTTILN